MILTTKAEKKYPESQFGNRRRYGWWLVCLDEENVRLLATGWE